MGRASGTEAEEEGFQTVRRRTTKGGRGGGGGGGAAGGARRDGDRGARQDEHELRVGGRNEPPRKVPVAMWICPSCSATSFLSRSRCFVCERRRPRDAVEVEERWVAHNLPNREHGRSAPHGPAARADPPHHRPQHVILRGRDVRQHAREGQLDARAPRPAPQRVAAPGQAIARGDEHEDEPHDDSDITGDELSYLNIVRKTARPKSAAKPKAGAAAAASPQQQQPCQPAQQQHAQDSQVAVDMEEGQSLPVPPKPFEAPPLPRGLLAARSAALEAKIVEKRAMGATPEEIAKLEARLGTTKQMLKVAGGGTHRKLHFEMLEAERKVTRQLKAVEAAEAEVAEAESGVLAAIERRDHARAALAAEHGKLHNARDHHAHLTLQAAAEASAHSSRYSVMHSSMLELQGILSNIGGMEQAIVGLAQVTDFLQTFLPVHYSVDHDPMLHETIVQQSDDDDENKKGTATTETQDNFKVVDAVTQAQADVDDLRRQANEAAAQAVRDAAARAVAVVTGGTAADPPSHTAAVQQFADRIKQAEANLQRAKADKANEAKQEFPPSPPPHRESSAASATAPEVAAAASTADAPNVVATGSLPAALCAAERVAALPAPPESSCIPAAFTMGIARHSLHRAQRSKFEGRFPPAQGGPRGRARSTESARKRSRSTPGAATAEQLDAMGDQVMGGATRYDLAAQPAVTAASA